MSGSLKRCQDGTEGSRAPHIPPHHKQFPWTWSSQNPTGTPVHLVVTSLGSSGLLTAPQMSLVFDDAGSFEDASQVLRRIPLVGLV